MPTGITIIGLGPDNSQNWTLAAANILQHAPEVYTPTSQHPCLTDIPGIIHNFDSLFQQNKTFEEVYQHLAEKIVQLGQRGQGVIFAVAGHPSIDEPTVPIIQELAQAQQIPVTLIPGLSLIEAAQNMLQLNHDSCLQIVKAANMATRYHPPLAPDQPALITQLHQQNLAAQIKKVLSNAYPDDLEITLVQTDQNGSRHLQRYLLADLDQQSDFNLQTILYVPADKTNTSFTTFQETIAHLRAPDGCPWDREQTHQSLRPFLLEEAYEVLETLDANDTAALAEEMGDLLLQIVLHVQIATDTDEFKMGAVIEHINQKLLRRHPHVFDDVVVNGVEDVTTNWEAIKQAEKVAKGQRAKATSTLDGIPKILPALTQALTISKRAVKMGFEWPNIEGVLDQLIEEAKEITEAETPEHLESEIGDLLFSAVNLARWRKIDPESALRGTNARFKKRFHKMEELAEGEGKTLPAMSLAEMEIFWNEAKRYERDHANHQ